MQIENKKKTNKTTINKETVSKSKPYNFQPKRCAATFRVQAFVTKCKQMKREEQKKIYTTKWNNK